MSKQIIAFDIGGTNTRCALVEKDKIIKFESVKTPKLKKDFLENVSRMTQNFMNKKVCGIGIAFPATIENGVIKHATNLSINNFDLKGYMEKKFKKKCRVLNDANCVALAESKLGCKKENFIVLTLGTGIGGGIIANGEIYEGLGRGGEFGHIYIRGKDFEDLWKGTKKDIEKTFKKNLLIRDLVKIKDKKAVKILEDAADYLGEGIASIATILDPENVVITGGLKESGPLFLKMIKNSVNKYKFIKRNINVSWSKLNEPGILGASLLIKKC